jgi:hypothetical protein
MTMPFLSIVTRCCRRPAHLGRNVESVLAQSDWDLEQCFYVDGESRGIFWANKTLELIFSRRVRGRYVYILDDDTRLLSDRFVARLKAAAASEPEVIMVRSHRPQINPHTLPTAWGDPKALSLTSANCLCYVVRADVWREHIDAFGRRAAGAGWFMLRLRDRAQRFEWLDLLAAETMQIGKGAHFENCRPGWFQGLANRYGFERIAPGDWRLRLYLRDRRASRKPARPEAQAMPAQAQASTLPPAPAPAPARKGGHVIRNRSRR